MEFQPKNEELLQRALERCRDLVEHDPELARLAPPEETIGGETSIDCLAAACERFAGRPCLAERAFEFVGPERRIHFLPSLRTTSYSEVWNRGRALASGLRSAGLGTAGTKIGICGFASPDWVVADFACLHLAAVSVPLQTSASPADLQQIIAGAELDAIVCSLEQLDRISAVLDRAPTVKALVVMDVHLEDPSQADALAAARQALVEEHGAELGVLTLGDLESIGHERGFDPPVDPRKAFRDDPDPLMTLMYTSGSTGLPKGAMFPESLWRQYWHYGWPGEIGAVPQVSVDYMPLNHMAGRLAVIRSVMRGGLLSFVLESDMSTLLEDIRLARPTTLMLIPRASSLIYQAFQSELVKRTAGIEPGDEPARRGIARALMEEMRRSFLGDRLIYAWTGTAPTAPEVMTFLKECFEIPVFDGYGSTEAGPITYDGRVVRDAVADFKLIDAPELGYRASDVPHPRGELLVRSPRVIPGYYRNPEATKELFDEDGYLRTGDIVEQTGPGELAWIDRRKNVLKLAQGEFVSTSRLTELYAAKSPYIQQLYIHGNSLRSYLLAVIVPDEEAVEARLDQEGIPPGEEATRVLLRSELSRIASEEGLQGFEVPRDFLIETEPFTRENGLLTESNKPSRPRLRARYGEQLEALYARIEHRQLEELYALGREPGTSVGERVRRAIAVTVGLGEGDLQGAEVGFLQVGGDSLSAVRLASLIKDLTGVGVPVGMLIDPTSRLDDIVRYVEARAAGREGRAVTFESIHGDGAQVIRAEQLRPEALFSPDELGAAARATPASRLPPRAQTILLTGANGFLGRFLLLALLERVPERGGTVICVVRAPTDAAALERLSTAYREDPALWEQFQSLSAGGRLSVLAGDLSKPRLGLSVEVHDRLAGEVDALVHNGALVNHAFSYAQLFEPNVLGTAEICRLALRSRLKSVAFVSTVGVAAGLARSEPVREDEDALSLWKERPVDSGYAVGYSTSKWADEVLLAELSDRLGLPVDVFRCSMILAHESYAGQINAGDFLTRLLASVARTGVAPRSFYESGGNHHFDGLPVDFVASSIARIAADRSSRRADRETFHVVNGRWDDGVSLDTLVEWVRKAGYPVERIDDYSAWLKVFRDRLEALGPLERQRSVLPILSRWERPMSGDELLFDNRHLRERLGNPAIPAIDERLVRKSLDDMVKLGLVPPPP